jgi:hypothetical protein
MWRQIVSFDGFLKELDRLQRCTENEHVSDEVGENRFVFGLHVLWVLGFCKGGEI